MKKIFVMAVVSIMMLAAHNSAFAQQVVNSFSIQDTWVLIEDEEFTSSPDSCWNWLLDNPDVEAIAFYSPSVVTEAVVESFLPLYHLGDTIPDMLFTWSIQDTILVRQAHYSATVMATDAPIQVLDAKIANAIDSIAAKKQVEYKSSATINERDDVFYYKTEDAAIRTDGIVPVKWLRKEGLSFYGGGSYTFCQGAGTHAFSGLVGVALTGERYRVSLGAGPSRNQYSPNAERAGEKYWGFESEAFAGVQLFKLDRYDQLRVFLGGSLNFNYYSTDSKPAEDGSVVRSKGNYLCAGVGGELSYRLFCKPFELFIRGAYLPKALVIQNQGHDRKDGWRIMVGFLWNFHR